MARDVVACFGVRALVPFDELRAGDMYHYHETRSTGPNVILICGRRDSGVLEILLWNHKQQNFVVTTISKAAWAGDKAHPMERLHMV